MKSYEKLTPEGTRDFLFEAESPQAGDEKVLRLFFSF